MLAAPLMSNLALLWIAVEITTVVSALLVAIEDTDGAAEAAWKYVLIASAGLGHRSARRRSSCTTPARRCSGQSYDLAFAPLLHGRRPAAAHARCGWRSCSRCSGFGTKVGLFPVHTWLPDAHSEAPTPVSALLSGSLLAVSFYAILRYYQVAAAARRARASRGTCCWCSACLAAARRAVPARPAGHQTAAGLLQRRAHGHPGHRGELRRAGRAGRGAAARAGARRREGQRVHGRRGPGPQVRHQADRPAIRGGLDLLPWSGPLFLLAMLALSAHAAVRDLPQRVRDRRRRAGRVAERGRGDPGRAGDPRFPRPDVATNRMLFTPPAVPAAGRSRGCAAASGSDGGWRGRGQPLPGRAPRRCRPPRSEPSAWMVVPVVAGVARCWCSACIRRPS